MRRKTKGTDPAATDDDPPRKGRKKLLIIALVAVLTLGAGSYFLVFSGGSAAAAPPKPGEVLQIDPVAINLAGGRYLKLGMALQLTADAATAKTPPNGAKALDLAIAQFSGAALTDVQTNREAMKAALQKSIVTAYEKTVMSIYYTEYVTQ